MLHTIMSVGIPAILIFAVVAIIFSIGYIKAPPDQAFIISGLRKKVVIGQASLRIPFFERVDKLSLKVISIDVKSSAYVPTKEFINIKVDATVNIKISSNKDLIQLAATNFLNKDSDYIISQVRYVLEGNLREIIGQMSLPNMVQDRRAFSEKVQANARPDLESMGLELLTFNVQSFIDENEVIENLGIDNISQIKKNAAIARAEAERDIAIAQAEAAKMSNEAEMTSKTQIAIQQNALAIKEAELKQQSDIKKAEADAAYSIQEQEQRKTIEVAKTNADIAQTERTAELKAKEVEVTKQTLDAEVRAKADASRYQTEQEAQAALFKRQKEAEAKKYEEEQAAAARRIEAESVKYSKEQEATGIRALGLAEAEAIAAKAKAEAEGIDKKAEAMQKYGEAAVVEMIVGVLPDVARAISEPLSKVDKITMYGEGNSAKLIKDIVNSTTQVSEGLLSGMGIDLKSALVGILGTKALAKDPTVVKITSPEVVAEITTEETPDVPHAEPGVTDESSNNDFYQVPNS